MKFVLTITLGNDAMRTDGQVARALKDVARSIVEYQDREPSPHDHGPVRDVNGNTVGRWHYEEEIAS